MAAHVLHGRSRNTAGGKRLRFDDHLPVDHRLSRVYRVGAGLMGLILIAFGILGLIDKIGFFDTDGDKVAGLSTNGALSVLSICVGVLLLVGMVIGGNVASTLNMVLGVLFVASGFINLALLDTDFNPLAFEIQNVLFSFVVGLMLMTFGMYGRVSSTLPHDNPYWRARHPEEAERELHASRRAEAKAVQGSGSEREPAGLTTGTRQGPGATDTPGTTGTRGATGTPGTTGTHGITGTHGGTRDSASGASESRRDPPGPRPTA
ncbi:DUF4383 domain-containing protein [Streptomyces sp. AM8-1-1]|uniref:DUF4383 domain-containing protein n=1 Tax=Streptomyces sp. AM8-1-1 TaxID=3075825 RepID=UPI0028C41D5F|nr:DUF4383 domain-containing protein [Streptomyces sp. AM8-1-1]WNO74774.1 DUF4383 domain-containing protein [Streptomyces sp. AM8-1-1]